ncbi:hypothetical protein BC828DRAFT_388416 [Blastocladiella britannica]|nr:hypothetical protein BC828DRAFT_388416 [Blastocladiella britannica]
MMSGAPPQSLEEIQRAIRMSAEEHRAAADELRGWEATMRSSTAQKQKPIVSTKIPPIRGSTTTATATSASTTVAPRNYQAWDKLDVDAMLAEQENAEYTEYHHQKQRKPTAAEAEAEEAPTNPELAAVEKETGNVYFRKAKYGKAHAHYSRAMNLDPASAVYPLNRAAALLKLGRAADAARDCTTALAADPRSVKAYFRRAQAHVALEDVSAAVADLRAAKVLEPTNREVTAELLKLDPPVKQAPAAPLQPPKRRRLVIREYESAAVVETAGSESVDPASASAAAEDQGQLLREVTTVRTVLETPDSSPSPTRHVPKGAKFIDVNPLTAVVPVDAATARVESPVPPPGDTSSPSVPAATTSRSVVPTATAAPAPLPVAVALAPPTAAFELTRDLGVLVRRGAIPGPLGTVDPGSVGDAAHEYLYAIAPSAFARLFGLQGIDADTVATVVGILASSTSTVGGTSMDRLTAVRSYNWMYQLTQASRFGMARKLVCPAALAAATGILDWLESVFARDAAAEAKVAKVRELWQC